ncbi:13935_t:CDS:2 [Cetraspora pellucida]|uniref:13935_t:CDS:1 n=1 Tax=Cetraspora pellucida TaxID=1433469 RepID=A0ACA9P355_9GLOM|nr:13935_t:CDS:2 [Cetraspora pellucida]
MNSQIVAIGFIKPLYNKIQQKSEIHCDTTYKTVKGRFELYEIICNFEGSGYPLAYLILNTTKASENVSQEERRTHALFGFFTSLHIQLCQWHVEKAINLKLKCYKKIQRIHYCPEDAAAEFNFIDLEFKPNLEKLNNEICLQNL